MWNEIVLLIDVCMWMFIELIILIDKCVFMFIKMKLIGMVIIKYMGNNYRI